ncbi:MAG: Na+/H+ antiporter NhaA, partial [Deinococcus sp.]|nr:Na+/H+ antiporter NhaA [Deinococcus sp.]
MRFSLNPIQAFLQSEAKGGFVLIAAALLAFFVAASPLGNLYSEALRFPLKLQVGELVFKTSPLHLVNDLLMAVFFLQVGLEIKRELVQGELRGLRKAMLPLAAAAGGMLIPALIYLGFNQQGVGTRGFGIPMATDIAFSLGVLSLLGKRVPFGMKVFLVSLAIVD